MGIALRLDISTNILTIIFRSALRTLSLERTKLKKNHKNLLKPQDKKPASQKTTMGIPQWKPFTQIPTYNPVYQDERCFLDKVQGFLPCRGCCPPWEGDDMCLEFHRSACTSGKLRVHSIRATAPSFARGFCWFLFFSQQEVSMIWTSDRSRELQPPIRLTELLIL